LARILSSQITSRLAADVGTGSLALLAWLPDEEIKAIIAVMTSGRSQEVANNCKIAA